MEKDFNSYLEYFEYLYSDKRKVRDEEEIRAEKARKTREYFGNRRRIEDFNKHVEARFKDRMNRLRT